LGGTRPLVPRRTDDPGFADRRNFYKVEKWSRDGQRIEELLFAGNSAEQAIGCRTTFRLYYIPQLRLCNQGNARACIGHRRQAMADLQIIYLLYFPKLIYCLFACHGALSPAMTDNWSLR
jgi:hypothetical protein